ncbi:phage antirepressor KilAC domain-containing protein [Streptomyces hundungensis]|uniref:phage antirepressor KilAC domain-containing protein n=1 Tax=Streptomyces hundungensis TaxID=1077946 RepID=UPI0031EAF3A8
MNAIEIHSGDSPFDAIKQTDEGGNEHWSARELMPILGYVDWGKFEKAIDRASVAIENTGVSAGQHVYGRRRVRTVKNNFGVRKYEDRDYHLTRYGAYMVAMNGDPRKPEIAAAQTYFAIKTREAETAQPIQAPTNMVEALELALHHAKQLEAAKAELLEAAPKVEIAERFIESGGTYSWDEVARDLDLGRNKLLERLRLSNVLMDGTYYDRRTGRKKTNRRHNLPYQRYENLGWFDLNHTNHYTDTETGKEYFDTEVFVTPKGLNGIRKILFV